MKVKWICRDPVSLGSCGSVSYVLCRLQCGGCRRAAAETPSFDFHALQALIRRGDRQHRRGAARRAPGHLSVALCIGVLEPKPATGVHARPAGHYLRRRCSSHGELQRRSFSAGPRCARNHGIRCGHCSIQASRDKPAELVGEPNATSSLGGRSRSLHAVPRHAPTAAVGWHAVLAERVWRALSREFIGRGSARDCHRFFGSSPCTPVTGRFQTPERFAYTKHVRTGGPERVRQQRDRRRPTRSSPGCWGK